MNNYHSDTVLLLTGTIKPNTYNTLKITDPTERLHQYVDAITFYLEQTTFKVVFVENSNTRFEELGINSARFEYITYNDPPDKIDKGKGWKEFGIIKTAFKKSNFLKDSSIIIKITGRLKVLNVNNLFSTRFVADKNVVLANYYQNNKMDSRCFLFSRSFLPYFYKNAEFIDTKYSFERCLHDSIHLFLEESDNHLYKQFKLPLRISGLSGGFGHSYEVSKTRFLLKTVKHFMNTMKLKGK